MQLHSNLYCCSNFLCLIFLGVSIKLTPYESVTSSPSPISLKKQRYKNIRIYQNNLCDGVSRKVVFLVHWDILNGFWGGGYFFIFFFYFFVLNGQVLLENARTRFEPNCANLFRGQNGHFWSYLDPKWRFRAVRGSGTP